jgi:hypothetical protein
VSHISPILIICLGLFLGLSLLVCSQADPGEYLFLSGIFILGFFLRIASSLLFYNFVFLSNGTGLLGDAFPYSENGYTILQMWLNGVRDADYIRSYKTERV